MDFVVAIVIPFTTLHSLHSTSYIDLYLDAAFYLVFTIWNISFIFHLHHVPCRDSDKRLHAFP